MCSKWALVHLSVFILAVAAQLLSEKHVVIIADFCAVYTLEDGYAHVSAV